MEPQPPGLKKPANGDEVAFVEAVQGTKLKTSSLADFKGVIRLVLIKLGVRAENWPSDEEKSVIMAHIQQEFGEHTVKEFALAFDLAIARKLDLPEKSISCYENFSCAYISGVMVSYRRWAAATHRQLEKAPPVVEVEHKEDTSDKGMEEWVGQLIANVPKLELIPTMVYDWLELHGKLKKTTREKYQYLQKAVPILHSQLIKLTDENRRRYEGDLLLFNQMKDKDFFEGKILSQLKVIAKRLILQEYLIDGGKTS